MSDVPRYTKGGSVANKYALTFKILVSSLLVSTGLLVVRKSYPGNFLVWPNIKIALNPKKITT